MEVELKLNGRSVWESRQIAICHLKVNKYIDVNRFRNQ